MIVDGKLNKEKELQKICCIIHSLGIGGMERVMGLLANDFSSRYGAEVHVILIGRKREVIQHLNDSIKVHRPSFDFSNKARLISTIRTLFFVRFKVKEIDPSSILSFGEIWNNLVLLAILGLKNPIIISDRSQPNKNIGLFHNILRDCLYPLAEGYIAQTEQAKYIALKRRWSADVRVIGNPVVVPNNANGTKRENIVLSVGRLIKTKHFDELIEIFSQIATEENWYLYIVGGNSKRMNLFDDLKSLIQAKRMENVYLENEQRNVASYYQRSKIFAFTSSSEGFPNALAEAMAAGLAVISYDCLAGPSDLIDDNINGFLIPNRNQEMYYSRLKQLMSDDSLVRRFGENAKKKMKKYSTEIISDEYLKFMERQ